MRKDSWAVSMERVHEKDREKNSDKRVVLWVGSYSTKTCHTRSNLRNQAGTGTISSGLSGLPGLGPESTV